MVEPALASDESRLPVFDGRIWYCGVGIGTDINAAVYNHIWGQAECEPAPAIARRPSEVLRGGDVQAREHSAHRRLGPGVEARHELDEVVAEIGADPSGGAVLKRRAQLPRELALPA